MKTDILTPKELFRKDVHYTIPPFQRPYVWTQDDQWEPLWENVCNVAEDYLEQRGRGNDSVEAEAKTRPHFLGAIVLQQVATAARHIEQREVIDGQQRVTTLQLLLDAVQQVCEDKSLRDPARRLSKLVTNDDDLVVDHREHALKLWPTRGDREAFWHAMDNGLAVNDFEDSLIVRGHDFFQEQVRNWLGDNLESLEERAEALETAVTAMFQMVVIDLDKMDDPNVIFETLNARGTPLEQSDLIKNFVLDPSSPGSSGDIAIWGDLDDSWWRQEVRQGRLFRPRLDILLNYWMAMRTGTEVGPSSVFNTFQSYARERRVDAVMSDVRQDLDNYRRYLNARGSSEEESFFYRTDVMQMGAITPVLLLLLSSEQDQRIRAFQCLESYLIRRMICRMTTKDYNHLTLELAKRLRERRSEKADRVVVGFLKEQVSNAREWPSDYTVASTLESSPLYRLLTRGRLRLVLEAVESRLRSNMAEQPEVPKGLTIEHLMPQSWEPYWALPESVDVEIARHRRNQLVQTIGNLTLVTGRLNATMSNGPWESKREGLLEHSTLTLNSELMTSVQWDEEAIQHRSRHMANLVLDVWPGPDSAVWNS